MFFFDDSNIWFEGGRDITPLVGVDECKLRENLLKGRG